MTTKQKTSKQLINKIIKYLLNFADENKPIKLPPERTIADTFSVSRRYVRLAIEKLELKGLVKRKQGCGNFILPKKMQIEKIALPYL